MLCRYQGTGDAGVEEEKKEEEEEKEIEDMVNTIKEMTGLWDIMPPDSAKLNLVQRDHNEGKDIPMGSIYYRFVPNTWGQSRESSDQLPPFHL